MHLSIHTAHTSYMYMYVYEVKFQGWYYGWGTIWLITTKTIAKQSLLLHSLMILLLNHHPAMHFFFSSL